MNFFLPCLAFLLLCGCLSMTKDEGDHIHADSAGPDSVAADGKNRGDTLPERSPLVDPFEMIFLYEHSFAEDDDPFCTQRDTFFNRNGSIWQTGRYERGRKEGEWIEFDTEGRVFARRMFSNGIPSGVWTFHDERGRVVRSEKRSDTLQFIYTFPFGEFHPVLITATADGSATQVEIAEDELELIPDEEHTYENIFLLRGHPFTGILIQEDVPTMRWQGIVPLREGRIHGQKIHPGYTVESYRENVEHGKFQGFTNRMGPVFAEGYYREGEMAGLWNYYEWGELSLSEKGKDSAFLFARLRFDAGRIRRMEFLDERGRIIRDSVRIGELRAYLRENVWLPEEE